MSQEPRQIRQARRRVPRLPSTYTLNSLTPFLAPISIAVPSFFPSSTSFTSSVPISPAITSLSPPLPFSIPPFVLSRFSLLMYLSLVLFSFLPPYLLSPPLLLFQSLLLPSFQFPSLSLLLLQTPKKFSGHFLAQY